MHYVLYCLDKPNAQELRLQTRGAHLDYVKGSGDRVRIGGALLGEDGKSMVGSLIVVEAESLEEVEAWAKNDPYREAGVFESVDIRPWNWAIGAPKA